MIKKLGPIRKVRTEADSQGKLDVYLNLDLRLTFDPGKRLVRAEASLDPGKLGIWAVSEDQHDQYAYAYALAQG
jgi:hypothetical protein